MLPLLILEFTFSFFNEELQVIPIVKYMTLSLLFDRFYDSFRYSRLVGVENLGHWLLKPIRESNLRLLPLYLYGFPIDNSSPLSVKTLKSFGDKSILNDTFCSGFLGSDGGRMCYNYLNVEIVFCRFWILSLVFGNVAFTFLEDLSSRLKGMAKVGELVNLEAFMDIMDLLYETEDSSLLYSCSLSLLASTWHVFLSHSSVLIFLASYVITVPKQRWSFCSSDFFSCEFIENFKAQYILDGVIDFLLELFLFC
ncbi:hypothetical protein K2173_021455 [Erythroxylum novogranatense]|uniref:Uncharacterized protein n=1 Tax=Erythroxylum novogranatense TaxID=1862640 RepID=A0AAV8TYN7_9ROSI|nr:hypothetical protein K2173_021455 [Erythroxylum novogranatense]